MSCPWPIWVNASTWWRSWQWRGVASCVGLSIFTSYGYLPTKAIPHPSSKPNISTSRNNSQTPKRSTETTSSCVACSLPVTFNEGDRPYHYQNTRLREAICSIKVISSCSRIGYGIPNPWHLSPQERRLRRLWPGISRRTRQHPQFAQQKRISTLQRR